MDELVTSLARERQLLDLLLFRLVEVRLLLTAGESRFLPFAAAEVEQATKRMQEAELRRWVLVSRLVRELGVDGESMTLDALARHSVEPYRTIFADHRSAFLQLVAEIGEVTAENRRRAAGAVPEAEMVLTEEAELAEAGYRATLSATAGLSLPSLADFLN